MTAPARRSTLPTTRDDDAVDASTRRDTGRITRNTASAPIHKPSGRYRLETACASLEMLCAVVTERPTGSDATPAAFAAAAASELGTCFAPSLSPDEREVAPEASWELPLLSDCAPPTSAGPLAARVLAPDALCAIPDWMPLIPLAVDELRVLPWLAVLASCAVIPCTCAMSAASFGDLASAAVAAVRALDSCETPPVYDATPELSWSRDVAPPLNFVSPELSALTPAV